MPKKSQDLISQLEAWEKGEDFRHQVKLEQRRKEVSALLNKHMKEATVAGKIEQAVQIREAIKRISEGIGSVGKLEKIVGLWDWWEGTQFLFIRSDGTGFLTTKPARQVRVEVREGRYILVIVDRKDYELVPHGKDELTIKGAYNTWKGKRIKLKS